MRFTVTIPPMVRSAVAKKTTKRKHSTARPTTSGTPAIRTYKSALNWLGSLTNHERNESREYSSTNFSVNRVARILSGLGNPHKQFKSAHIAGTKGKGSTATMLARMLEQTGHKVGLYTSPHLVMLRERISIDGELIPQLKMVRLIRKLVGSLGARARITYFEALTCVAFMHFADEKIDVAVVETGLGGRLDSTNVLQPEVCGITSISIDHVAQLGRSLPSIAAEKAGIIKKGVPVVSAPQRAEVKAVLQETAARMDSKFISPGEDDIEFSYRFESSRSVGPHTRISLTTPNSRFEHLHVPLLGEHQAINCSLALTMLDSLKSRGFEIDDQKAMAALTKVSLSGRMELIREEPRILVDGAHNAASVEALMRAIGQNIRYDSMVVIFGCHRDKDIPGMLKHVQLGADKVVFTSSGSPRAVDPLDLAAMYAEQTGKMAQTAYGLSEAIQIAESVVTKEDLICITGSFYLVGLAKKKFQTNADWE